MKSEKTEISWNTNWTMIPNEIWDLDLELEERMVLIYLIRFKNNQEEVSYQAIAEACKIRNKSGNICKRKTRRIIEKLASMGLIEAKPRV